MAAYVVHGFLAEVLKSWDESEPEDGIMCRERQEALKRINRHKKRGEDNLTEEFLTSCLRGEKVYVYTFSSRTGKLNEYPCVREGFRNCHMSHRIGDGRAFTATNQDEFEVCGQTLWMRKADKTLALELFGKKCIERAENFRIKADRADQQGKEVMRWANQ